MHGSSDGQCSIIPPGNPISVCQDFSNKYFQGRSLRQKNSNTKFCLFVDLYNGASNDVNYCAYSFVNNECYGTQGRVGQYFAITILCKNYYVYPETIYKMLHSAYIQMYNTGKILSGNSDGHDQYVISQFQEQEDYILALLKKIGETFSSIAKSHAKLLSNRYVKADYDSWKGEKINLEYCNSESAYNTLCDVGRIFVSEEYESQSVTIKKLEEKIKKMEKDKEGLERKIIDVKQLENSKARKEIDDLNTLLRQRDEQISNLNRDNERYKSSIEIVTKELEKFAKVTKTAIKTQEIKSNFQYNKNDSLLKTSLLSLILILIVASSVLNYYSFCNISSIITKVENNLNLINLQQQDSVEIGGENPFLEVSQTVIEVEAKGISQEIEVSCNSIWTIPITSERWLTLKKIDDSHLLITVSKNTTSEKREYTFMISSESEEKQIKITQLGKSSIIADYGLTVTDMGGHVLTSDSKVTKGQSLNAYLDHPNQSSGYGWKYSNCQGPDGNLREVKINITGNPGEKAIIAYGDLNNRKGRQQFTLNIRDATSDHTD